MKNKLILFFDKILLKKVLKDYIFICSKEYECDIKEYKGVKVYYSKLIQKGLIMYLPNIYI